MVDHKVESKEFPEQSGTGRYLPEDILIRGLISAPYYFPPGYFAGQIFDEDERALELPSYAGIRAGRCLWLGVRLTLVSYDGVVSDLYETRETIK